ncbi:hypothetical protein NE237_002069 [Protea cynaroides]|uniref:Glycoside hydrolase family 3 C-terminal domain-containing protein n=1 Tax=Protea cynaroides TaxID=273540 RepID=A0A9Q0QYQ2_9MAGN|nr:hypothetical protein NE237_002069 [Protea cynaroides]
MSCNAGSYLSISPRTSSGRNQTRTQWWINATGDLLIIGTIFKPSAPSFIHYNSLLNLWENRKNGEQPSSMSSNITLDRSWPSCKWYQRHDGNLHCVTYAQGCDHVQCKNDSLIFPAMEVAKNTNATIIIVGLDTSIENEGLDRLDLNLPGYQNLLIKQVRDVANVPIILIAMSAGGVDISFAKGDHKIPAILWAGYTGEEGHAIAEVVFGKYNPGKLAEVVFGKYNPGKLAEVVFGKYNPGKC